MLDVLLNPFQLLLGDVNIVASRYHWYVQKDRWSTIMKIELCVDQLLLCSRYVVKRIGHDRINVNAGYLAYITLLSIVPMLTVLLSVLSSFSVFQNTGDAIQDFVITHFVPAAGDAVKSALYDFVSNTGKMSAVGGGFLFPCAFMLISNYETNLN